MQVSFHLLLTSEDLSRVDSGNSRVNPPSPLPTLPSPQPFCAIRLPGAIVISLWTLGGNYTTWGQSLPCLSPEASPQHSTIPFMSLARQGLPGTKLLPEPGQQLYQGMCHQILGKGQFASNFWFMLI